MLTQADWDRLSALDQELADKFKAAFDASKYVLEMLRRLRRLQDYRTSLLICSRCSLLAGGQ
jgi:hypothetical protein